MSTSSFVTEVLATAGRLEKEDLSAKLGTFSKRTEELKSEVYEALQKKYEDFYPNFMSAADLSSRVDMLSSEMDTVANKVEKELKAQLTMSSFEFQDLSAQLEEYKAIQSILERLVQMDVALEECDGFLASKNYLDAARSLTVIEQALSKSAGPKQGEIKILRALQRRYTTQCGKVETDIAKAWSDTVRWDVGKDEPGIRVSLYVNRDQQKEEILVGLSQAMQDLDILDPKLKLFGERFLQHIVEPILTCENLQIKHDPPQFLLLTGKKSNKNVDEIISPEPAIQLLSTAFSFLHDNLFKLLVKDGATNIEQSLMRQLGQFIDNKFMSDYMITKCLKQSIPSNNRDLEMYSKTISLTDGFQTFLADIHFLSADDATLSKFVNDVNILFANKKSQEILQKARLLMTSDIHNMVKVTPDDGVEAPAVGLEGSSAKRSKQAENQALASERVLSVNTFRLPTCSISESTKQLMDLVYATLQEATQSNTQCSIQLFYSVRYIFFLFCEVVPTYHRESLDTLPQISALHHNNCMYLAHHLLTLGHQFRPHLAAPLCDGAATFVDLVPKLRRLGTDVFLRQMAKQRDLILECLTGAQGFVSVSEDDNNKKAERAIKQVVHQIQRLHKVWLNVLPPNTYNKSIGTLINTALVDIIAKVTSLDDISADDASHLHSLLSILTFKAPCFLQIDMSDEKCPGMPILLQANVRKWNKYRRVVWMLNANLQDIADCWADGKGPLAAECHSNEVKQLIRALFQNTDKRSQVLATIKDRLVPQT